MSTVRRDTDGERYVDKVLEYARASGRNFSTFHERLFWPTRELWMILKNRSSVLSITDEDIRKLDDPGAIPRHQAQLSKLDLASRGGHLKKQIPCTR